MSLDTTQKQQLINTHQTHATDTGSAEVQVAMLTERISQLSSHLQKNIHDFSSRQGLKMIVAASACSPMCVARASNATAI